MANNQTVTSEEKLKAGDHVRVRRTLSYLGGAVGIVESVRPSGDVLVSLDSEKRAVQFAPRNLEKMP